MGAYKLVVQALAWSIAVIVFFLNLFHNIHFCMLLLTGTCIYCTYGPGVTLQWTIIPTGGQGHADFMLH